MCQECGCDVRNQQKIVDVQKKILKSNDTMAAHNREMLNNHKTLGINFMSSPGAGKTTLLEKTIEAFQGSLSIGVIEGDLETDRDAERIRSKGVPVLQINTGQACHLDASMLHDAMHKMPIESIDLLFVENVGNLVCPATFDLGTHINVVLLSITEGDDKPAKYPVVFRTASLMLLTKMDFLPYSDFNVKLALRDAKVINPDIEVIQISSKSGDGFDDWLGYLRNSLRKFQA